jgi:hypothetical protein
MSIYRKIPLLLRDVKLEARMEKDNKKRQRKHDDHKHDYSMKMMKLFQAVFQRPMHFRRRGHVIHKSGFRSFRRLQNSISRSEASVIMLRAIPAVVHNHLAHKGSMSDSQPSTQPVTTIQSASSNSKRKRSDQVNAV